MHAILKIKSADITCNDRIINGITSLVPVIIKRFKEFAADRHITDRITIHINIFLLFRVIGYCRIQGREHPCHTEDDYADRTRGMYSSYGI